MYVSWRCCETGAPCIDPKRPYGNSLVAQDIYKILGWPHPDEEDDPDFFYDGGWDRAEKIHKEMETALQVVLRTGSFEPGAYVSDPYVCNWRREPA